MNLIGALIISRADFRIDLHTLIEDIARALAANRGVDSPISRTTEERERYEKQLADNGKYVSMGSIFLFFGFLLQIISIFDP